MPDDERYYSNPRIEMAAQDYAPSWHPHDDYDDNEKDPSPYDGDYDDGGDDE